MTMAPYLCSLASGSSGNALLVASAEARVLVDMGLSQRRVKSSLKAAGLAPEEVSAVLLTHTHTDHFSAAAVGFCLAHHVPVYSAEENLRHLARHMAGFRQLGAADLLRPIDGAAVEIGDVTVESFDVPHDSHGRTLGFRLTLGPPRNRRAVSVATDLGHMPADCLPAFIDADVVVLESNHDPDMLRSSGRPWPLIERIAGPQGHLANEAAADALAEIVGRSHPGRVGSVVLAHLSRDCNTPQLALEAQAHLARRHTHPVRLFAATQWDVGPRIDL
jgi:phosphoribosyl 1,2-cyclic phosphodiesterase